MRAQDYHKHDIRKPDYTNNNFKCRFFLSKSPHISSYRILFSHRLVYSIAFRLFKSSAISSSYSTQIISARPFCVFRSHQSVQPFPLMFSTIGFHSVSQFLIPAYLQFLYSVTSSQVNNLSIFKTIDFLIICSLNVQISQFHTTALI